MTPETQALLSKADEATSLLKSLSHPSRLIICCQLRDQEMSVGEMETKLNIKQPNLSRELARLREDGLVLTRRESKVIFYRLSDKGPIRDMMDAICHVMKGDPVHVTNKPTPQQSSSTLFRPNRPGGYGIFARPISSEERSK